MKGTLALVVLVVWLAVSARGQCSPAVAAEDAVLKLAGLSCGSGAVCALGPDQQCHVFNLTSALNINTAPNWLSNVSFPLLAEAGTLSFFFNDRLRTVDLPALTHCGNFTVRENAMLTAVRAPKLRVVDDPVWPAFVWWSRNPRLTDIAMPSLFYVSNELRVLNNGRGNKRLGRFFFAHTFVHRSHRVSEFSWPQHSGHVFEHRGQRGSYVGDIGTFASGGRRNHAAAQPPAADRVVPQPDLQRWHRLRAQQHHAHQD